jgi:hypothetical protein
MAGYRIYGAWDDFRVSVNALKVSGSKPPSWTSYKGGEVLAFSDQAYDSLGLTPRKSYVMLDL